MLSCVYEAAPVCLTDVNNPVSGMPCSDALLYHLHRFTTLTLAIRLNMNAGQTKGPNGCVPQTDFMNVVISKNITTDSLYYAFRHIAYTYSDPCFTPPFGVIDTFTQILGIPDSSIFWYESPPPYAYGSDSVNRDTVYADPTMHNRKRNEHWFSDFAVWGRHCYMLMVCGNIYFDDGRGR